MKKKNASMKRTPTDSRSLFGCLPATCQGCNLGNIGKGENGMKCTPPKFNMEPENDGFQKESPFPGTSFQVPC